MTDLIVYTFVVEFFLVGVQNTSQPLNDNRKTYCGHVNCDQAAINSFE